MLTDVSTNSGGLTTYRRVFAGQEVELNLRHSLFFTAGLAYSF
jgi:hypothetical protein